MKDTTGFCVPLARMKSAASSSAVPPISPIMMMPSVWGWGVFFVGGGEGQVVMWCFGAGAGGAGRGGGQRKWFRVESG
jgi:hypothetical protein